MSFVLASVKPSPNAEMLYLSYRRLQVKKKHNTATYCPRWQEQTIREFFQGVEEEKKSGPGVSLQR